MKMETPRTRSYLHKVVIFFVFILFFGQSCAEVDITGSDTPDTLDKPTPKLPIAHFVLLYTNPEQCEECEAARTLVQELMDDYNIAEPLLVTISEVDCSQNVEFCATLDINSFPEFLFFPPAGEGNKIKYIGDFKKEDVVQFITGQGSAKNALVVNDGLYELTKDTFKTFVAEGNHFIKFYAPWCGHCKKLAPAWSDLARDTESEDVKISKVDCTTDQEVCKEYGVRGYPTLKFFGSGEEVASYSGARNLDALKQFVTEQVEKRNAPPPAEEGEEAVDEEETKSPVRELTDKDFHEVTGSGHTFVMFYAPWCGHCKRLAPTWEELAESVSDLEGVVIAKVDCTLYKEVCSEIGVRGYPTLYLFKDGIQEEKYSKGRDLESLKAYLSGQFKKDEL